MAAMILSGKEMTQTNAITCLFLDIGGVLLTNGWGHEFRHLSAQEFGLDPTEMEERHQLNFETYENGKLTLEEYLSRVVFYQPRVFTSYQFREFMFAHRIRISFG